MEYKRYEKHKDSGVEWIGDIPDNWVINKIKHTTYVKGRIGWQGLRAEEFIDEGPYLVTGTDFINGSIRWGTCYHVSEERYNEAPPIQLKNDDLLITKDGTIGKVAIVSNKPDKAILNSGIFLTRTNGKNYINKYMYWLLNSNIFTKYFEVSQFGSTIQHLYQETFENFSFPEPNIKEQQTIVNFLDQKTSEIDDLIADKEKLISLLQEQRQAIITEAVTKGLNPDVRMKDSGIEWIGEIPEHWEVQKIKYLLNGIIDTEHKTVPFYDDGEFLVVRTSNVRNGKLILEGAKYTDKTGYDEWTRRGCPKPGDILFTREAPAGEACLVPQNMTVCIGQRMVMLHVNHQLLNERFGIWSLYGGCARQFIQALSQGTTVSHFNMSDIANIPIITPPINVQVKIADWIDKKTSEVDMLIENIQTQVLQLKEYRQALISEAVTGKIDVRGYSA